MASKLGNDLKGLLRSIYQYALEDGAELVPLSACFDR